MNETIHHKDVWTVIHCGLTIEVVHFGMDNPNLNRGQGIWNYYIYVHENKTRHFRKLWLKDEKKVMPGSGREYINHDYYSLPLVDEAGWHGGITYYAKRGHSVGHRCVQIGCDFSHLWDEERGFDYTLDEVMGEAKETAQVLARVLEVKQG
jgi:hypothetical protein